MCPWPLNSKKRTTSMAKEYRSGIYYASLVELLYTVAYMANHAVFMNTQPTLGRENDGTRTCKLNKFVEKMLQNFFRSIS